MRWILVVVLMAACGSPVSEPKKKSAPKEKPNHRLATGLPIGLPITMHKLVPKVRWSYSTAKRRLRDIHIRMIGRLDIGGTGCKDFGENAKIWHIGFQQRGYPLRGYPGIRWYKMLCFRQQWFSFLEHSETFYCRCQFDPKTMKMLPKRCLRYMQDTGIVQRHVRWEHVVPVSSFGSHRSCWKKGYCKKRIGGNLSSRECCRAMDMTFRKMEANLVNLVPVVGTLNVACKPKTGKRVKPIDGSLGKVARIRLYMRTAYSGQFAKKLTREQYWRLMEDSEKRTPHRQESVRNDMISNIQPPGNPLVSSEHRCGGKK